MPVNVLSRLSAWIKVSRERQRLAGLPEQMLRDMGVDRGVANAEAGRPFWDLPASRRDLR